MHTSLADQWFAALDQHPIGSGQDGWVAQVLAVHTERDGIWVQVAPVDDPSSTIVLHVSSATHLDDVVTALERQSRPSEGPPAVIDLLVGMRASFSRPLRPLSRASGTEG
jgi:hypothetical protein